MNARSSPLVVQPLADADCALTIVDRAVEISPNGVADLIEALRMGMPVYEAEGVYLVCTARLVEAAEIRRIGTAG